MPLTLTSRLNLPKQGVGDTGWGATQNSQFDLADARLFRLRSLEAGTPIDPNASVQAHFIGQFYVDTTTDPPLVWIAVDTAAPSDWRVISTDAILASAAVNGLTALQDILEDLNARIVGLGDLASRDAPARLYQTKAAEDTAILGTGSPPAEVILSSFNRLVIPGTLNGSNLFRVVGSAMIEKNTAANQLLTLNVRAGTTGNGLTDAVRATAIFKTNFNGGIFPLQALGQWTPALDERVSMTLASDVSGSVDALVTNCELEVLEVLD